MPRLKNLKHEVFAKNVVKHKGNLTEAYMDTYKSAKQTTANSYSCLVAQRPEVKTRIQEIMDAQGLTLEFLTGELKSNIVENKKDCAIRQDAIKTGFKLQKVMSEGSEINIDARSMNQWLVDGQVADKLLNIANSLESMNKSLGMADYHLDRPIESDPTAQT